MLVRTQSRQIFLAVLLAAVTLAPHADALASGAVGSFPGRRLFCEGDLATVSGAGVITGTEYADIIVGSSGKDLIYGLGGNDRICGLDAVDIIYAGDGFDIVFGGNGSDRIWGEIGDDTLYGQGDVDILDGGDGDDACIEETTALAC